MDTKSLGTIFGMALMLMMQSRPPVTIDPNTGVIYSSSGTFAALQAALNYASTGGGGIVDARGLPQALTLVVDLKAGPNWRDMK